MDVNFTSKVEAAYTSSVTYEKTTGKKDTAENEAKASPKASAFKEPKDTVEISAKGMDHAEVIKRLKADADARMAQMKSLVEKLLMKQGDTIKNLFPDFGGAGTLSTEDMISALKSGNLQVDSETAAQAQKDIADDGYWGFEETSTRMVEFAISISGDNTEMADKLMDAIKKGFDQANKMWGGNEKKMALPELSKKTLDRALQKMEAWKNGDDWRNLPKDTDEKSANGSNLKVNYTQTFSYKAESSFSYSDTKKTEE